MSLLSRLASRPADGGVDYATIWGAAAAFGLVLLAIVLGGDLVSFFDVNSLLIVLGGTIGATLITFPLEDLAKTIEIMRPAIFPTYRSSIQRVGQLIELAQQSRSEGELSLESFSYREADPFLRKGIQLVVDGVAPEEVRRILETELLFLEDRHRRGAQIFQTMGAVAPAMGLIGTLIGLVQMLQNLDDPSGIGPGMALALLTTFYGALFAHVLFLPLAGKLRMRSEEERLLKEMTIEGLLGIAQRTNPRLIEQRLHSFLAPDERYTRF